MEMISIPISIVSLAISVGTFWLAFLRRGRLAMTMPTIVFFGHDMTPKVTPKVFLRTLLYSTAAQGQMVEGMYVQVLRNGLARTFSFWGYGETEKLSAGSGLHISRTGLAANHHFVLSVHEDEYRFEAGDYTITVYARVVGRRKPLKLSTIDVSLDADLAAEIAGHRGVLFERSLDGHYQGHARER